VPINVDNLLSKQIPQPTITHFGGIHEHGRSRLILFNKLEHGNLQEADEELNMAGGIINTNLVDGTLSGCSARRHDYVLPSGNSIYSCGLMRI
jgi:hypothetical protein